MGIKELFLKAIEQDKPEKYLTEWQLQDTQETRDNQRMNFHDFVGKEDLQKWMSWANENRQPCYLSGELTTPLVKKSFDTDKAICDKLGIKLDWYRYQEGLGRSNAIDYIFPSMFKKDIKNVLDVGAGYGRQANLWSDGVYVGMDAVLNSYCTQNLYYKSLGKPLFEYLVKNVHYKVDNGYNLGEVGIGLNGIYHLPTWKYSMLPDNFFDMVMCVQCIRELSEALVRKILPEFYRVLKSGAILYIRDHKNWNPCNTVDIDKFIKELGFIEGHTDSPHFKHDAIDGQDLHGSVQIYQKI